ncbi:MAG: hypothetical protein ACLUJU_05325 [Subdoligranulum sp.]
MRRQQSENGNNGNSGSGSSGNNSQMQQFMKIAEPGPRYAEARRVMQLLYPQRGFQQQTRRLQHEQLYQDRPFDIILMYYNDLKKTSSNFNDDDSNAGFCGWHHL